MHMKFDYPQKTRTDFLQDVVKQLVKQRHKLGITQDDLNHTLGVADRLVSHWECGVRSPTAFHLYCWTDALQGQMVFLPNKNKPLPCVDEMVSNVSNDNLSLNNNAANDNMERSEPIKIIEA